MQSRPIQLAVLLVSILSTGCAYDVEETADEAVADQHDGVCTAALAGHHWERLWGDAEGRVEQSNGELAAITFGKMSDKWFEADVDVDCTIYEADDGPHTSCATKTRAGRYSFWPTACNRKRVILRFDGGEKRVYAPSVNDGVLDLRDSTGTVLRFAR